MNKRLDSVEKKRARVKIFTIPNILSLFRICLIPLFMYLYVNHLDMKAFMILVISGLTDVCDGFIARRFDMVSSVGKILDPISDKLTQGAMLLCLLQRFKAMWIPFLLMFFKEVFSGIVAMIAIKKTGEIHGADWHGKITTLLIYSMMSLHILWPSMPEALSFALVGLCVVFMVFSLILYSIRNISIANSVNKREEKPV